ncbi:hypothetical protein ACPVPU_09345 [Sphingomonas sp. CJ99]
MTGRIATLMAAAFAALVAWPAMDAWFDLADARTSFAAAKADQSGARQPLPPLAEPGSELRAIDAMAARRAIASAAMGRARAGGLLVERIALARGTPRLAAVRLRLSGSEAAVIALIDHLERQRPMVRLARWRLTAAGEGTVRLDAVLVSPWRR